MRYVLNLVYLVLITAALPWLVFAAACKGKYREGWAAKLLGLVPRRRCREPCIWFHAVSAGEVNLTQPLLEELERRYPQLQCVVSTTTKTGFDLARERFSPRNVFYCPLDFSWAVSAALRRVRPDLLVLVELEVWPNLIRAARHRGCRVAVVNGRLGEKSARGYRRIRWFVSRWLRDIDLIAVQDDKGARRFRQLGAADTAVQITGSLKFDGAETDRDNESTRKLAALAGMTADDVVLMAGSTQEPEEALALATFVELAPLYPQLRLVLVPRHPERFDAVARLLDESNVCWQRRSAIAQQGRRGKSRVLLVDTVGELRAWWGTADIAFVGGSMGHRGGQNMIEPAAYGAAVCFGPNTWNFQAIVEQMLAADASVVVQNGQQLTAFVRRCLEDPQAACAMGRRAQQLVQKNLGATKKTADLIEELCRPRLSARVDEPSTRRFDQPESIGARDRRRESEKSRRTGRRQH